MAQTEAERKAERSLLEKMVGVISKWEEAEQKIGNKVIAHVLSLGGQPVSVRTSRDRNTLVWQIPGGEDGERIPVTIGAQVFRVGTLDFFTNDLLVQEPEVVTRTVALSFKFAQDRRALLNSSSGGRRGVQ